MTSLTKGFRFRSDVFSTVVQNETTFLRSRNNNVLVKKVLYGSAFWNERTHVLSFQMSLVTKVYFVMAGLESPLAVVDAVFFIIFVVIELRSFNK